MNACGCNKTNNIPCSHGVNQSKTFVARCNSCNTNPPHYNPLFPRRTPCSPIDSKPWEYTPSRQYPAPVLCDCQSVMHNTDNSCLFISSPRQEPYFGTLKIINAVPVKHNQMTYVKYSDGRYDLIANGYIPDNKYITNNGPKCVPCDDIRGNITNSEGMDVLNFQFNNSDTGATF